MHVVYWLHSNDETDILTEGYVGITKDLKRRMREHQDKNRNYSVVTFGSKYYCHKIENKYRPKNNIGLNKAPGGQGGGMTGKNHSVATKKQISTTLKDKTYLRGLTGRLHPKYGHKQSLYQKTTVSTLMMGNTIWKDRKHSSESREKMRQAALIREAKKRVTRNG